MARHLEETDIPIEYKGMKYNVSPSALRSNNLTVELPEVKVLGKRKNKGYKSAFNPNGVGEFAGTIMNSPLQLADYAINRFIDAGKGEYGKTDYKHTPVQTTMQRVGETVSPTKWIGTIKTGFKESPWSENNPGLTGNPYLDMITDAFAMPTIAKTGKWGHGVARNIKHRNRHAYVTIDPVGYNDPVDRFKAYAKSILSGKDVDINAVNPSDRNSAGLYIVDRYTPYDRKRTFNMSKIARDEAWRKYLGLPSRERIYIDNGDGTVAYNMPKIQQLAGGIYKPYPKAKIVNGQTVDVMDQVTGAGGGLTRSDIYETVAPYTNAEGLRDIIGKQVIEDVWDLHPFSRAKDQVIGKLQSLVNKTADKTYKKLYDKLYSFDKPYHRFAYNYLGGSFLNKLRNSNSIKNSKTLNKLNKKLANFEVGPVLGGKPFKMHTELPYTKKYNKAFDIFSDLEQLKNKDPYSYYYGYEQAVPKGILDIKNFEPKPVIPKVIINNN